MGISFKWIRTTFMSYLTIKVTWKMTYLLEVGHFLWKETYYGTKIRIYWWDYVFDCHLLHRIKRLSDGKLGGWIEKEENLSQESNCWVDGEAKVYDDAKVYGNAKVYGDSEVCGHARVNYELSSGKVEN